MTTKTYIARTFPFKVLGVFLMVLGSLLLLFGGHFSWFKSLVSIPSLIFAYLSWKIPTPKIEVDDNGIRRLHRGKSRLFSRMVQPDTEFKWNSINSVSTMRLNSGTFLTALYSSEEAPDKPKHRVTIESSLFKEYVSILKIIKDRAAQARFDETTELIVTDRIDIRSVRPLFCGLFIFVVVSTFVFFIARKG